MDGSVTSLRANTARTSRIEICQRGTIGHREIFEVARRGEKRPFVGAVADGGRIVCVSSDRVHVGNRRLHEWKG